jgi:hypothetical protein
MTMRRLLLAPVLALALAAFGLAPAGSTAHAATTTVVPAPLYPVFFFEGFPVVAGFPLVPAPTATTYPFSAQLTFQSTAVPCPAGSPATMQCATTTGSGMASFLGAFTAKGAASIDVSSLATAGCASLTSGSLTMTLAGGDVVVLVPGPGVLCPTGSTGGRVFFNWTIFGGTGAHRTFRGSGLGTGTYTSAATGSTYTVSLTGEVAF